MVSRIYKEHLKFSNKMTNNLKIDKRLEQTLHQRYTNGKVYKNNSHHHYILRKSKLNSQ